MVGEGQALDLDDPERADRIGRLETASGVLNLSPVSAPDVLCQLKLLSSRLWICVHP